MVRSQSFSIELFHEICSLMHGQPVDFRQTGELVAIGKPVTRDIHYMPPSGGTGSAQ
jgi:hypothetical protein